MKAITVGKIVGAVTSGLCLLTAASSMALPTTFIGNNGSGLSASATFSVSGNDLNIVLVNTGAAALNPANVLTIVYFNLNGAPTLTPISAVLGAGSSLYNPGADSGSIGGNWQYKNVSGPGGATAGISTTGIGAFGPVGNFGAPTAPLDGAGFGVVHGVGATANTGVTGRTLINNSVVFDLTLPVGYNLTSINDVSFQYGTSSDEPLVPGTPGRNVPDGGMTLALLGTSLCGLGLFARRRK
jgi:hypothetical protein